MRILLISGEFPPMEGGVGDYTREMARAYTVLGQDLWVLTSEALGEAQGLQEGERYRVLPTILDWKWGCWGQVGEVLHQVRPDVVNIQFQAAAYNMRVPAINLLPLRLRLRPETPPVVTTYHDLKPPYLFPKAGPLRTKAVQVLARYSAAAILTNAEDMAIARGWRFAHPASVVSGSTCQPTLHHIPIGSNIPLSPPQDFDRAAWRAQQGYDVDDFVWAYFGFLNESKGGETLFRALAKASCETRLLMIGGQVGSSDPTNQGYATTVQRLIEELGLGDRVQWTGYLSTEQVSAALLSADAVVLPYRDGVSFRRGSLHAALTHGCAIISTTPHVALPELRDGENILLVPPDRPQALARAAVRLQRSPLLRQRIGEGARTLAGQFTWPHIARRTLVEVFEPLVARQQTGVRR